MKRSLGALITCFLFLSAAQPFAQERPLGLGIIVGEPTGISAKLWVSQTNAIDFGLGWSLGSDRYYHHYDSYNGDSRVHFHMDYLWHWFNALRSSEQLPLYMGIGGRVNTGAGYDASAAIRGVFGIAWMPRNTPIDLFLELVPALQVVPSTGFGLDAGIGARFYF
ncbi:MAG: hypothetical protein MUF22_02100 [Chitinispirillaceae bacterium]|jgi:hypothetical protein|nr:hypothetical protein [Chitinispirillaceae bacterium]